MTWLLILGEILLFLYLIVEVICVFTYRRRLRKTLAVDLQRDHFDFDLDGINSAREAFFEGYRYLLYKLPEDFFKPKHRMQLAHMLNALSECSDPCGDIPPEQE